MGGTSSEREVSMASGRELFAYINKDRFNVICIEWNADNSWSEYERNSLTSVRHRHESALQLFLKTRVDIVLIALHGKNGEDGRLQGFLDIAGIPYTGCGVLGSALGMNKKLCKQVCENLGILTPKYLVFGEKEPATVAQADAEISKAFGYPCVVKPNGSGSSIGVTKVHGADELESAISKATKEDRIILVEEYVKGAEFSVAVLGDYYSRDKLVLPIVEIVPDNEFFDYEAKYVAGKSTELVPARISPELAQRLGQSAMAVHDALMCEGYSRVDFLVKDDKIFALEINTLPGMTNNSLYPKMAREIGMTFTALIDKLIDLGLAHFRKA